MPYNPRSYQKHKLVFVVTKILITQELRNPGDNRCESIGHGVTAGISSVALTLITFIIQVNQINQINPVN
jgi:hypothetical protein